MSSRARKRGYSGKGSAQRRKERALGLHLVGVSKPMLDAMNEVSHELYSLGVGVLVQEEDRERRIAESLHAQLHATARHRLRERWRLWRSLREAEAARGVWEARMQAVSERVAQRASGNEVQQWAAHR